MSSYTTKAVCKKSGEVVTVFCHDDYFSRHVYGYSVDGGPMMTKEQFEKEYRFQDDKPE